ncbi:MAG: hypothetical protein Q9187_001392 [Circinaria calcarea]
MAGIESSIAIPRDDLDDLYNYDIDNTDDVFREFEANMEAPVQSKPGNAPKPGADLGIDSEVQVVKKRKPIAKLDENRLLSQAGIPKLRRITKERLKFKGKGHEYSDVARLLNLYQLWLDDLYPRAKFADGLAIIEKLGHTKRMQIMRREWINEGKPRDIFQEEKLNTIGGVEGADQVPDQNSPPSIPIQIQKDSGGSLATDDRGQSSVTADLRERTRNVSNDLILRQESLFLSDNDNSQLSDDDDLDALLAEDLQKEASAKSVDAKENPQSLPHSLSQVEENFDDDLEAMAGMDDMW